MTMKRYVRHAEAKDARHEGRIILAFGEVTGHCHEVLALDADVSDLPAAEFFEEPDGRRVLLVLRPCALRHQEHAPLPLDPAHMIQARQGDVLLNPIGPGAWQVIRQVEYTPTAVVTVAD